MATLMPPGGSQAGDRICASTATQTATVRFLICYSLHEGVGTIPGLTQWVRDPHCCKVQHRSKMWLRSGIVVAVAQACSRSFDSIPSTGTSICPDATIKGKKILCYTVGPCCLSILYIVFCIL